MIPGVGLALDLVLAVALPVMAWRVLTTDDLRAAVVLFVALGLLSALAWSRLAAPDIALVEAAVGTGLTGALVMSSLAWAEPVKRARPRRHDVRSALPALAVVGILVTAVLALAPRAPGLDAEVRAALAPTGASHPVTAVLLGFRAYDTFLEILVLVVAALGVDTVLAGARSAAAGRTLPSAPLHGSMVDSLARALAPVFVLVAGYLVWAGSHAPGGAFQAAAVAAGGGVLALLAGRLPAPRFASPAIRAAVAIGPLTFAALAALPLATGAAMLASPRAHAGAVLLALEIVLVVTITVVLVMFFPARVLEVRR